VDAELIVMTSRLWKSLGITDMKLEINSLGQANERAAHREALVAHLEKFKAILDEDGLRRMYTNPLRVLDTKNPALQDMADAAPKLSDYLGDASREHLDGVLQRISDAGVSYQLNPRMVRGLDYYNLTVFEWITDKLGAQATVCGGGRYDGLIELLGGKPAPAVGFAIGVERLIDLWGQYQPPLEHPECSIYIIHQGEDAHRRAAVLAEEIRDAGISVVVHPGSSSFKSQFKRADSSAAAIAVILAGDELAAGVASVKMLRSDPQQGEASQHSVPLGGLISFLKDKV
jgi:histidyl-tRNA synthetase